MTDKKEKIIPQVAHVYFKCDRYGGESCHISVEVDGFDDLSSKSFKPSKEIVNKLKAEIILFTKKKIGEM